MKAGLLALTLAGSLFLTHVAAAQTPEERAARLSQRIMSPFCDGVTLHDCPSKESDELRAEIAGMAREGMTDAQILNRLEAEYGPGIRATPKEGVAWVTPALFAMAGLALVVWLARRWTPSEREPAAGADRPRIADSDRARVQAELAAFRDEP
ncbi:MAG TPA: cytochrome c-type biogenesis protein CcmH [Actinomycetota bacterium]|nr:cytochrome c-type biogenesis protein CcmH [Actinomycetota bacterium]